MERKEIVERMKGAEREKEGKYREKWRGERKGENERESERKTERGEKESGHRACVLALIARSFGACRLSCCFSLNRHIFFLS